MKKIYLLLTCLFAVISLAQAQVPANRTSKTIVADVLAQLPANKPDQYEGLMKDLASTGENGILQLTAMLNAPGKGDNSKVEYALSGLSHYASEQPERTRIVVASAYVKALDQVTDREIKAFIIRQLEIVGKEEGVAKLAAYLGDETLSGPASRALAVTKAPQAATALLKALPLAKDNKSKEDIILALAYMQEPQAEPLLKGFLNSGDPALQKTVLYALSRTGAKASLPDLAIAADNARYTMEATGATEAYITLLKRVLEQGDILDVRRASDDLMKKATKANATQTRNAALSLQLASTPDDAIRLVVSAVKDSDREFRNAALTDASVYANQGMYMEVAKLIEKAKPEQKSDIINWFAVECLDKDKLSRIRTLKLLGKGNNSITFQKVLEDNLISDPSLIVKEACASALVNLGDYQSIDVLAQLLKSDDKNIVDLAQSNLAAYTGDVTSAIAQVLPSASDNGKVAILQLFANRKSVSNYQLVVEQLNSTSKDVKEAAYSALKDVASMKDLPALYAMLESADDSEIVPLQKAIISALAELTPDMQIKTIEAQMKTLPKEKQALYYTILASTNNQGALDIVTKGFDEGNGKVKDMAFGALLSWNGLEVADKLFSIGSDTASTYSDRALSQYIEVVSAPSVTAENQRLFLTKAMTIAKNDKQKNTILRKIGQTNTFLGMIFAGNYLDHKTLQESAAGAVLNIALANPDFTGKDVENLLNKVLVVLDNPDADYQRQAVRKHLGELPKEDGYVRIFNGKDFTGWKGLVEDPMKRPKMKPADLQKQQEAADAQMLKDWKVEDEAFVYLGKGYNNICTTKDYGDIEMYVDWMLDPNGPEPDGGIYLRGCPQIQMWDIRRTDVGAQVGSGGLYNNQVNASKPLKVMDNKLGEWNTFYIKMVGDRVTVKFNGETVVDNVILENYWDRSQPIPAMGQLELQAHGCPIYYKNVYVKELPRPQVFELSADEKKEGYRVLFDGTNMHQWTGNTVDYILEDGCISMHPSNNYGGNLYTKDEFGNFIYRFEFQLTPGANNGIGIRTPMEGDAAYVGMEIQVLDHDDPIYNDITPFQTHGSVYGIIAAKRAKLKPVGEWNYEEIVADGNHIKVTLNGEVIVDGDIKEAVKNGTPDGKEHPGLFNKKGHIGFLGHGSPVKFKNIRIKELK